MYIFSTLFLFTACGDEDSKDGEASNEPSSEEPSGEPSGDAFSEFVNVDVSPAGDQACFDGTTSSDDATWLTQDVDTSKQEVVSFTGEVIDFETDDPVEEAFVEIWFDGVIEGATDQQLLAIQNQREPQATASQTVSLMPTTANTQH